MFAFITLFIALFFIYSNSFQGDWHYDDFHNIVLNANIQMKSFPWNSIKDYLHNISLEGLSRPLSYFSFSANYYIGGLDVFGYHIVNFIIHYLASLFLFLFIFDTLRLPLIREKYENIAYPVALLATSFWALHPIHVTSVTYIVQRMTSMAGLFYILAMYLYLKARTTERTGSSNCLFAGCTLAGLCAVLSKENAVMLPVSLVLYDLLLIQGVNKENIKRFSKILFLPFLLILVSGLIYIVGFSHAFESYNVRDFSMIERLLTEPRVIIFYLSLLFYPINSRLTFLYDIDISRSLFHPWTTLPAILLVLAIITFALYNAKKRPLLSFCLIFFFLNHLIEGTIFPLELIYEHRNYLPSMLLFIPVAEFIIYAINYFSYKIVVQFIVAAVIVVILVGQGDGTYQRNNVVSSKFLLWMDNIEKYPNLSRPYTNLGNAYMPYDQKDKVLYNYNKAMELNNFANTHIRAIQEYNLGIYYFYEGKFDLAFPYFERAYQAIPSFLLISIYTAKIHP